VIIGGFKRLESTKKLVIVGLRRQPCENMSNLYRKLARKKNLDMSSVRLGHKKWPTMPSQLGDLCVSAKSGGRKKSISEVFP
jgi:hypothetical protein